MEETKYLRWYNKIGYGSGDIAGNVVYAFLSTFMMIFLTDTIGLDSGIIGTLMLLSKVLDGVTDIFFGSLIDKTKSKLGKARPWMLYGYIGCAIMLVAIFAIPVTLGEFAQYAWFFIAYTALNAVFYTANNIAYSALTSLITKNNSERVQMGSIRFMFAFGTSLLIQTVTVKFVEICGGGASGWRTVAIIYALIGLIVNTMSALSVKELPEEDLKEDEIEVKRDDKLNFKESAMLLGANKFYLVICVTYVLMQIYSATLNMVGIYFMTYILGNANLLGVFSWAINIPLIIGLIFTPMLVKKFNGMYKLNVAGYVLATAARGLVIVAGYMGNVPLMLLFSALASLGMSPLQGDLNALIASCSEYTYLTKKKRIDGTMYSCTSFGTKIGCGIGTAIAGWLLSASGYIGGATVQAESCIHMLYIMYLWIPLGINLVVTFLLTRMKVEDAIKKVEKDESRYEMVG